MLAGGLQMRMPSLVRESDPGTEGSQSYLGRQRESPWLQVRGGSGGRKGRRA